MELPDILLVILCCIIVIAMLCHAWVARRRKTRASEGTPMVCMASPLLNELEENIALFGSFSVQADTDLSSHNDSGVIVRDGMVQNLRQATGFFSYCVAQVTDKPDDVTLTDRWQNKSKIVEAFAMFDGVVRDHPLISTKGVMYHDCETLRRLVGTIGETTCYLRNEEQQCGALGHLQQVIQHSRDLKVKLDDLAKKERQYKSPNNSFPVILTQAYMRSKFVEATVFTDVVVEGWKSGAHVLLQEATPLYFFCIGRTDAVSRQLKDQELENLRHNFFRSPGMTNPVHVVLNAPLFREWGCEEAITPYDVMLFRRYSSSSRCALEDHALSLMESEGTTRAAYKHVYPHRLLPAFFFMLTVGCLLLLDLRFVNPPRSPVKETLLKDVIDGCMAPYLNNKQLVDDIVVNRTLSYCPIDPTGLLFSASSVSSTTYKYTEQHNLSNWQPPATPTGQDFSFVRALFFKVAAAYDMPSEDFHENSTAFVQASFHRSKSPSESTLKFRFVPLGSEYSMRFLWVLLISIFIWLWRVGGEFFKLNESVVAATTVSSLSLIGFVVACLSLSPHYAGWLSCIGACFFSVCGLGSEVYFLVRDAMWERFRKKSDEERNQHIKACLKSGKDVVANLKNCHNYEWTVQRAVTRCTSITGTVVGCVFTITIFNRFSNCTGGFETWADADEFEHLGQDIDKALFIFGVLVLSTAHLMTNVEVLHFILVGCGIVGCFAFAMVSDPTTNAILLNTVLSAQTSFFSILIIAYVALARSALNSTNVDIEKRLTVVFDLGCSISRPYQNRRHLNFAASPIVGFLFLVGVFTATTIFRATSYASPSPDKDDFTVTSASFAMPVFVMVKGFIGPIFRW